MRKVIQNIGVNQQVKEFFLLTNIEIKAGKNGSYFEMSLADASGEMKARKWDLTKKDLQLYDIVQNELPIIVLVKGISREFQQSIYLKLFYIVLPNEDTMLSIRDFIPHAPININEAFQKIEEAIKNMKNTRLQKIVNEMYQLYKPDLAQYPASLHHHRVYGGLVWHIVNTLRLSETLLQLYPEALNEDLLTAGAILHDFAKIKDYKVNKGVVTQVTDKGRLIGHVVGIAYEIHEMSKRLGVDENSREVELLEHIILSHHSKGNQGNQVEPRVPEAIALQLIVELDTKIGAVYQLSENTQLGEWSEWSKLLGTRIKKH